MRNVLDGVEPIWVRSQQDDAAQALYGRGQEQQLLRRPIEEGEPWPACLLRETDKSFSRLLGRLTVGANGVQNQTGLRLVAREMRDGRKLVLDSSRRTP